MDQIHDKHAFQRLALGEAIRNRTARADASFELTKAYAKAFGHRTQPPPLHDVVELLLSEDAPKEIDAILVVKAWRLQRVLGDPAYTVAKELPAFGEPTDTMIAEGIAQAVRELESRLENPHVLKDDLAANGISLEDYRKGTLAYVSLLKSVTSEQVLAMWHYARLHGLQPFTGDGEKLN